MPRTFKLPQRIYIHAGKRIDNEDFPTLRKLCQERGIILPSSSQLACGGIVGEVEIYYCVGPLPMHFQITNPWFVGPYGFLLRGPVAYPEPFPLKGSLGFFEVELPERTMSEGNGGN